MRGDVRDISRSILFFFLMEYFLFHYV